MKSNPAHGLKMIWKIWPLYMSIAVAWDSGKEKGGKARPNPQITGAVWIGPPHGRDKLETVTAKASHTIHKPTSSRLNLPSAAVPTGPPVIPNAPFPIRQSPRCSKVIWDFTGILGIGKFTFPLVQMTGEDIVGGIDCWLQRWFFILFLFLIVFGYSALLLPVNKWKHNLWLIQVFCFFLVYLFIGELFGERIDY